MKENTLGVIPARRGSSRLPSKPLQLIGGIPLVVRVFQQARLAKSLTHLVVATDDTEIAELCAGVGAEVVMTSADCENGSARVAEAARVLAIKQTIQWGAVANIQGDMPYISPALIDRVIEYFLEQRRSLPSECAPQMVTVGTPISSAEQFATPSVVKVAIGAGDRALYFSRAAVPHSRDGRRMKWGEQDIFGYRHLGLYVFSPDVLSFYEQSKVSELEQIEMLEQLRLLEAGYRVAVCRVEPALCAGMIEVDTPEDLARANAMAK